MSKERIGKVLKDYRKRNSLSVEEVSVLLLKRSMKCAPKTIYGWESGQTQPNAETLLALCEIYKIDNILSTFGYNGGTNYYAISEYEGQLIKHYRQHPEMHNSVHKLLDM